MDTDPQGEAMAVPNELTFRLSRRRESTPRARAALRAVVGGWGIDEDVAESAELVLSELVTNAVRVRAPQDRQVEVRIVYAPGDGLLTLEVSDAGAGRPEVRMPGEDETCGRGLLLVEALAHRWGVRERAGGIGKTVWAEFKTPGAVPVAPTVAAITVRPGQRVRVWGSWQTVLSVRSERYASGDLSVALGFGEGPALRLHAAEPLAVRGAAPE